MVNNIIRYVNFLRNTKDVLSSGGKKNSFWKGVACILLCFFLVGYLLVAFLGNPDLMIAGILFGGSIFVSIVLTLLMRMINTVKENCLNIAETLIGVVDARDPNLKGHSQYVRNLCMLLYDYLPLEKRSRLNRVSLEFAALMHDIGKLGIPEEILNKPEKLTEEEWKIMRNHPKLGVDILKPLFSFREIFPWIEYHHEQISGQGYYGILKDSIPFASRLISVADTYSAITMRRSYKEPRSYEEAVAIMIEVAGKQLDAELVEIFCQIPKKRVLECVPDSLKETDL
ncbi:MAG: HD domain-containing protein [Lachnospiraceae bacterium]|nr:HD domain-containing protein [Lachnospiraceae bacterium]